MVNTLIHVWTTLMTAQVDAGPAADPNVQVQSVWDFVVKGGPMMILIGLCSLIALAVIIERLISLRKGNVIPAGFLAGLQKHLKDNDDRQAALEYCQNDKSPVANVFATVIRKLGEPLERLEKCTQEVGEREVFALRKYLRLLAVIALVSPLLGLLGTVFGMIEAFQTVAAAGEALGKTEMLAKGIYEAMITTAAGLMVTIPALIGYHGISARIERLAREIDGMTLAFIEEYAEPALEDARPRFRQLSADEDDSDERDEDKVKPAMASA
ncbi:MAG: MotA/TolQ/ExbB proton channel family protein [Phycisphaerales bacterium]|nr:MAG: MotA/TolQ/ExbB proton channel family protein [Phycisphaerales bacterium]